MREVCKNLNIELSSIKVEFTSSMIELNDEIMDEIDRLKREMDELKQRVGPSKNNEVRATRSLFLSIGDMVEDIVGGFTNGIEAEIKKSILVGPGGVYVGPHGIPFRREKPDFSGAMEVLAALASEPRLNILNSLTIGGKYASDIEKEFSTLSPSTVSSHLKTLEEAGLIAQEGARGRYLVTIPGRVALKMATHMTDILRAQGKSKNETATATEADEKKVNSESQA